MKISESKLKEMESRLNNIRTNQLITDEIEPLYNEVEIIGGAPNVHSLASNEQLVEISGEPEAGQVLYAISENYAIWSDDYTPILHEVEFPIYPEVKKEKICDDPYVINISSEGLTNPLMSMAPIWKKVNFYDASLEIEVNEETETYLKSVGPLCYLSLNVYPINIKNDTNEFYIAMSDFPYVNEKQSGIGVLKLLNNGEPLLCEVSLEENGFLCVSPQTTLLANTQFSLQANLTFCKK